MPHSNQVSSCGFSLSCSITLTSDDLVKGDGFVRVKGGEQVLADIQMVKSKGAVWYCHRLAVTLDSPIPPKHTLNGLGILHLLLRPAGLADDAVGVVDKV